jgi:murein DD-endopeptidase MepM/ murein hydrolase activator NlpD
MLSAIGQNYAPAYFLANTRVYRPLGSRTPAAICPGAPWRLPTNAGMGVQWGESGLDFFGRGNENSVPVYAVADGLLTRLSHWADGVAIQHDDPLRPGEKVWTYYAHMASASSTESYVVQDFPPGSASVSVRAGQLLGYQGRWSERAQTMVTTWVHLRFAVVRATEEGRFPDGIGPENTLDPSPYLGIVLKTGKGYDDWQPLRCSEAGP